MAKEIYTVKEVTALLGLRSEVTVIRRIKDGSLKAFRTNGDSGHFRVLKADLDEFMSESKEMVEAH